MIYYFIQKCVFRDPYISATKAILIENTCYANLLKGLDLQILRGDSLSFLQKPSHWLFEHPQYGSNSASTTIKSFCDMWNRNWKNSMGVIQELGKIKRNMRMV